MSERTCIECGEPWPCDATVKRRKDGIPHRLATPAASGNVAAVVEAIAKGPVVGWRWADALRALHRFGLTYEEQPEGVRAALAAAAHFRAESAGAPDVERLAEAMWFEGLISGPPNEDVTKDAAESLLSAYRGLVKHHAADPTP